MARRWLYPGLELWRSEPLHFERDYFLPLPTADFQGTCRKRARYSDAAGFSRALFSMPIVQPDADMPLAEAMQRNTPPFNRSEVNQPMWKVQDRSKCIKV